MYTREKYFCFTLELLSTGPHSSQLACFATDLNHNSSLRDAWQDGFEARRSDTRGYNRDTGIVHARMQKSLHVQKFLTVEMAGSAT